MNNTHLGLRPFQNNLCYFAIDADQLKIQNPVLTASVFREIMSHFEAGTFQPLPHVVFPAVRAADAFRFMQQAKHMGKIVLSFDNPEHEMASIEPAPLKLARDAAYVISGGLGGFGMATARWLASLGARHLVLLGRRGLRTPGALEAINELKHNGVRVAWEKSTSRSASSCLCCLKRFVRRGPRFGAWCTRQWCWMMA